ncbi:hypothetical protein IFO70_38495 [Phormidium tenue FACHB-886]|nr:hypothetical protein [Phormidium tenue FACHB-886]
MAFIGFIMLLVALLEAMTLMRVALEELDIERFYFWSLAASVIAGLPTVLW